MLAMKSSKEPVPVCGAAFVAATAGTLASEAGSDAVGRAVSASFAGWVSSGAPVIVTTAVRPDTLATDRGAGAGRRWMRTAAGIIAGRSAFGSTRGFGGAVGSEGYGAVGAAVSCSEPTVPGGADVSATANAPCCSAEGCSEDGAAAVREVSSARILPSGAERRLDLVCQRKDDRSSGRLGREHDTNHACF